MSMGTHSPKKRFWNPLSGIALLMFSSFFWSTTLFANSGLERAEAACRKKLAEARANTSSPPDGALRNLRSAFAAQIRGLYAPSGWSFLEQSGRIDRAFQQLLETYSATRAQYLDRLEVRMDANFKRLHENRQKFDRRATGLLCSELDRYEFVEKNAFSVVRYQIFEDIDQTIPFSIGFKDFELVQDQIRNQVERGCDTRDLKWISICFLTPDHQSARSVQDFKSSQVACLVPRYLATLKNSGKTYGQFRWIPEIHRGMKNITANRGACVIGSRVKKSINYRGSIVAFENHSQEQIRAPNLSLANAVVAGSISGGVVDAVTGFPISGATVKLETSVKVYRNVLESTNSEGKYRVTGLPMSVEKRAKIRAEKTRFHSSVIELNRMSVGRDMSGYDHSLSPILVTVMGTAYNEKTNLPIVSEPIEITLGLSLPDGSLFSRKFTTKTDSHGKYSIENVPNTWNQFAVAFKSRAYVDQAPKFVQLWRSSFEGSSVQNIVNIDFKLSPRVTSLSGVVRSARSGSVLSGMQVEISDQFGEIKRMITDSSGRYSWIDRSIPSGHLGKKYRVRVFDTHAVDPGSDTASIYFPFEQEWAAIDDVTLIGRAEKDVSPLDGAGNAIIPYIDHRNRDVFLNSRYARVSGRVIDGQNGEGISNAEVSMRFRGKDRTVLTTSGHFYFEDVPPGKYQVEVKKDQFSSYKTIIQVLEKDVQKDLILLREKYSDRRIVTVLTWDKSPRDLDSHLFGKRLLLNYKTISSREVSRSLHAQLDRDDVSSYGPETTIIETDSSGRAFMDYKFMVYNYSGEMSLTADGVQARVNVFRDGDHIGEFYSTDAKNREHGSQLWYVFAISGDRIEKRNEFQLSEYYELIKEELEKIATYEKTRSKIAATIERIDFVASQLKNAREALAVVEQQIYHSTGDERSFSAESRTVLNLKDLPIAEIHRAQIEIRVLEELRSSALELQIENIDNRMERDRSALSGLQKEKLTQEANAKKTNRERLDKKIYALEFEIKTLESARLSLATEPRFIDRQMEQLGLKLIQLEKGLDEARAQLPKCLGTLAEAKQAIEEDDRMNGGGEISRKKDRFQQRLFIEEEKIQKSQQRIKNIEKVIVEKLEQFH